MLYCVVWMIEDGEKRIASRINLDSKPVFWKQEGVSESYNM